VLVCPDGSNILSSCQLVKDREPGLRGVHCRGTVCTLPWTVPRTPDRSLTLRATDRVPKVRLFSSSFFLWVSTTRRRNRRFSLLRQSKSSETNYGQSQRDVPSCPISHSQLRGVHFTLVQTIQDAPQVAMVGNIQKPSQLRQRLQFTIGITPGRRQQERRRS
jgi:hypothetical protein